MVCRTVGGMDRSALIILGLALIAGYFARADLSHSWLYLVAGITGIATGLVGRNGIHPHCELSACCAK